MIKKSGIFTRTIYISLLAIMFSVTSGRTAVVSINPPDTTVNVGDKVIIDLVATELNGLGISAFNLTLNFDPTVFQFIDFVASEELGDLLYSDISTNDCGDEITFDVCSISNLLYLQELQTDANKVTLGSLTFKALQVGKSNLTFSTNDYTVLGDIDGIGYDEITYESAIIKSVPEPSIAMLTLFGLSALFSLVLHRKKNY